MLLLADGTCHVVGLGIAGNFGSGQRQADKMLVWSTAAQQAV